jgi:hypothetical protein
MHFIIEMHALPRQAAAVKMKSENIQSKLSTRDFFFFAKINSIFLQIASIVAEKHY